MKLARWIFTAAGIYGLIVLFPNYFLEARIGHDNPPTITHVEYFYGFVGLGLMWQVVFLLIGRDPVRYRPLMLAGIGEKISFAVPAVVLYAQGRLAPVVLGFAAIDALLAIGFTISWFATADAVHEPRFARTTSAG